MKAAREWLPFGLALLAASSLLLIAGALAPALSLPPRVAYALAFTVVGIELLSAAHVVPAASPRAGLFALLGALPVLWSVRALDVAPWPAAALTLALLAAAAVLGSLIGSKIEKPGHLVAVFAISALADLWSVYDPAGPSAKLAQEAATRPEHLVLFALPWPMLGSPRIEAIIGVGDLLFAALYSSALRRHALDAVRAAWAMGAGLLIGLALLLTFERALPLLPLIGGGVMLAVPEARSLPAQDRRSVSTVVVLLCAFLVYRFTR